MRRLFKDSHTKIVISPSFLVVLFLTILPLPIVACMERLMFLYSHNDFAPYCNTHEQVKFLQLDPRLDWCIGWSIGDNWDVDDLPRCEITFEGQIVVIVDGLPMGA